MLLFSWLSPFTSTRSRGHRRTRKDNFRRSCPSMTVHRIESLELRTLLSAAPVVDLDANNSSGATGANFKTTFTEGGAPVLIADADATILDSDSANLSAVLVSLTNIQNPGEELLTATTAGTNITSSYNTNSGLLRLTGKDTPADYAAVLRTVKYSNSSDNPGNTVRIIQVAAFNKEGNDDFGDMSNLAVSTVSISAVNDSPVLTVPTAQTITEDVPLDLSSNHGNAIQVADPDAGTIQITLGATNGTLSLQSTSGLSFSFADANGTGSGDGTNDATMIFRGSVDAVNVAMNGLTFTPAANFSGSANLSVSANDLGNSGSGGVLTASDSVSVTVRAANDAPINSVPAVQTVGEGSAVVFNTANGNQISVSDVDAGSNVVQASIATTHGTMTLSTISGLSFGFSDANGTGAGDGTADSSMTFRGTLSAINAALNGLTFNPTAHFAGNAGIVLTTNDLGHTGGGGALTDTDTASVDVTPDAVNDAPVNMVPGAQTVSEDTALVFSTAGGNSISVSDDSVGSDIQVTLSVTSGTLTVGSFSNLSFSFADANGTGTGNGFADSTMTFRGTQYAINAALSGLTYQPGANVSSGVVLSITTNDLGNTGTGGVLTATNTVPLTVTAVNDAPVNHLPGAQTTNQDTALTFNTANGNLISVSDVDAGSGLVQVSLTAAGGTLTLASTTGLSFSFADSRGTGTGDGTADASMTFRGTLTDVNTALNGLVFVPTPLFHGTASLTMTTNDLGNTGSGGARAATNQLPIYVNSTLLNDSPGNTVPPSQTIAEDSSLVFSAANGNAITVSDSDAGASQIQMSLTAAHGTLTLATTLGLTFAFSDANGTGAGNGTANATMTFRGTQTAINAALDGLRFTPAANFNGAAQVVVTSNDLGNTGVGVPLTDTKSVHITVTAVNDAPVNHLPSGVQMTRSARVLVFSTTLGNAISVSDVDAGSSSIQVSLTAVNGLLSLSSTSGLSFTFSDANGTGTGDGTLDPKLTFRGTIGAINAALNGLQFTPIRGAFAASDGSITISANDLGNTGAGGSLTQTDVINIAHNEEAFLARMFRLYNPNIDMHFFTSSAGEFTELKRLGLNDEATGQAGFDVVTQTEQGAVPLHRLYNANSGEHYYTISDGERDFLVTLGWRYEKDEGFIFNAPAPGTSELFRLYNRNSGEHLFTTSVQEKNDILAEFPGIWVQHMSVGYTFSVTAAGVPMSSGASQSAPLALAGEFAANAESPPLLSVPGSQPQTIAVAPASNALSTAPTSSSDDGDMQTESSPRDRNDLDRGANADTDSLWSKFGRSLSDQSPLEV